MSDRTTANGHSGSESVSRYDYYKSLVVNFLTSRLDLMKRWLDPRRNLDYELGYPETWVDPEVYQQLYEREALAARVVEVFPKECWQVTPNVYEDEDGDTETAWEAAWNKLGSDLAGDSYHQQEKGSRIWEVLRRADIQSGIGCYGIILIGIDDGLPMDQPAAMRPKKGDPQPTSGKKPTTETARKLTYLQVFPEYYCRVMQYEHEESSPRFGLPTMYSITFGDAQRADGVSQPLVTRSVHWTRVVHIAEDIQTNAVYAAPRMRPVLNRILDVRKVYGPDAESFYKNGIPGWVFQTHPELGSVDLNKSSLKDEWEKYTNSMTRLMTTEGGELKPLTTSIPDPTPHVSIQIQAICYKLGIPQRIFMGSERGELASSQDDAAWNDRLRERQNNYITPRLIVPFIDRLIALGVLPEPQAEDGYKVWWPDLESQGQQEKATIAASKTNAIASFFDPNKELWTRLAPVDFWSKIMGYDEKEAKQIVENAEAEKEKLKKEKEEAQQKQMELQDQQARQGMERDLEFQQRQAASKGQSNGEQTGGESDPAAQLGLTGNVFCKTGQGGGIDPTCAPKKGKKGDGTFEKAPAQRGPMMEAIRDGKGAEAKVILKNGKQAPDHIKPSMIPPDWQDVRVSLDPKADLLVSGFDSKGRPKAVYAESFHTRNAEVKFARVNEMMAKSAEIDAQIQAARSNPKTKEAADCAYLMSVQATRPGSKTDTGADRKAYGATTLEGRHVIQGKDGTVRIAFIGKEGVLHNHVIRDPKLAAMLLERKKASGARGKLFDTNESKVNSFIGTLDGGHFSAKDFRTRRANQLAVEAMAQYKTPPKDEKEYKQRVKEVAEKVSGVLGNRPQQALESYINPAVFAPWQVGMTHGK